MNDIPNELKEFYNSIENLNSLSTWNIMREINPSQRIDGDWEDKLITERKSLNYNINKGILITNSQVIDSKGEVANISLEDNDLDYLKIRLEETSNTWLKSRYSQLLWQETKHNKYAEIANDNYIQNINRIKGEEVGELPKILSAILHVAFPFLGHL